MTGEKDVPLSGAVPLKASQDRARCVVDMSTEATRAGAPRETAAWNKGHDIGYIGESLQISVHDEGPGPRRLHRGRPPAGSGYVPVDLGRGRGRSGR